MPITLTDENFEAEVLEGLVLVIFSAEWCGPSHIMTPVIEELTSHFAGRVKVGKLDIDHDPSLAAQYGVGSTPTLLFFRDGHVVDQIVGVAPKRVLADKLHGLLQ